MHDTQIEDRLRRILRTEGDQLPQTITTAELERRLHARRRAAGGRRLSLVAAAIAAVAVGGMVAVTNGWVNVPSAATQPSASPAREPSPSPSASPETPLGLDRIKQNPSESVLIEVPPRISDGTPDSFDVRATAADLVLTITFACVGDGSVEVSSGDQPAVIPCRPPGVSETEFGQPATWRRAIDRDPYAVSVDAQAGFAYALLVEHVTLPGTLPDLAPLEGKLAFDAASALDHPVDGPAIDSQTTTLGSIPGASTQQVMVVCLGPGAMTVALGDPNDNDSTITSSVLCDGMPQGLSNTTEDPKVPVDVVITVDPRTAWHVIATQVTEIFTPPTVNVSAEVDGVSSGLVSTAYGCGSTYAFADGRTGSDPCGTITWPTLPEQPPVRVPRGGPLRFSLENEDWRIRTQVVTAVRAYYEGSETLPSAVETLDASVTDDPALPQALVVPASLGPGEWVIKVRLTAQRAKDTFTAEYLVSVTVL